MAGSSTSINYTSAQEYVGSLGQVSSVIDSLPKASQCSAFTTLEALGLSGGFPSQFDSNMDSISDYISSLSAGCSGYISDMEQNDSSLLDDFFPPGGTSNSGDTVINYGGGSSGGSGGSSGSIDTGSVPVRKLSAEDETKASITSNGNINIDSISDQDFEEVISTLKKLSTDSDVNVDELLGEEYSDAIKEALLKSLNLSQEFKEIVDEGSSVKLVEALKSLIDGKVNDFKTDEVMSTTVVEYLNLYAQDHNLTYDQLVNDEVNIDLLREGLSEFSKVGEVVEVANEESIQDKLLAIYQEKNGISSSASTSTALKTYVDNVSKENNVEAQELLTNDSYKDKVYESTASLNNTSKVTDYLSSCSQNTIIDTLKNIHLSKKDS